VIVQGGWVIVPSIDFQRKKYKGGARALLVRRELGRREDALQMALPRS